MACTTILVGKAASLDGSTMIARQEDYGNALNPQRFAVVLPEDQPRKYASKTTSFTCDLPDNPLRYTSNPDADPSAGVFGAAGINTENVAMTATETATTNARIRGLDPYNEESGIGEEDFVTLVLPYIHSAREGVVRLGKLLEAAGTYEPNGIAFADAEEVWYFETIGGHHWAAIKIPDDAFVVAPNRFNIDYFDFASPDTMAAADLKHWIDVNDLNPDPAGYNLRHICGSHSYQDARYNNPRAWYVQRLFGAQSGDDSQAMDLPFICHPAHRLAVEDLKQAFSAHYQGTPDDPYTHDGPDRFRSIALNRNLELHVLQLRSGVPAPLAAVHWLAFGPNTFNALVPFYANVVDTPEAYKATTASYDPRNMYWLTHTIAALGDADYVHAQAPAANYEETVMAKGRHFQHEADREGKNKDDLPLYLTGVNDQMATVAVEEGTKLLGQLVKQAFLKERLQF